VPFIRVNVIAMCCRVSTLEPCQCCVLPCPARSRSKGVPTVQISASMPRLPRQKQTLSKDLYPPLLEQPLRYLKTPSQALRRHSRSSHGVGYLSVHAPVLCLVSSEAGGTITGPALSPFPLGQGEIPGLPQCVPEPIYVIFAGETIPGRDTLVTGVWGMENLRILTYPL
jgi:hypothetical protein